LVCKEGLARLAGGDVEVLRWDAVAVLRQTVNKRLRRALLFGELRLEVQRSDGSEIHFDDVVTPRLRRLIGVIFEATLPHLLPPVLNAWMAGDSVRFDRLLLSRDDLRDGARCVPWTEVAACRASRGWLTIRRVGRWRAWLRAPVTAFANVCVLLALVQAI